MRPETTKITKDTKINMIGLTDAITGNRIETLYLAGGLTDFKQFDYSAKLEGLLNALDQNTSIKKLVLDRNFDRYQLFEQLAAKLAKHKSITTIEFDGVQLLGMLEVILANLLENNPRITEVIKGRDFAGRVNNFTDTDESKTGNPEVFVCDFFLERNCKAELETSLAIAKMIGEETGLPNVITSLATSYNLSSGALKFLEQNPSIIQELLLNLEQPQETQSAIPSGVEEENKQPSSSIRPNKEGAASKLNPNSKHFCTIS